MPGDQRGERRTRAGLIVPSLEEVMEDSGRRGEGGGDEYPFFYISAESTCFMYINL